jgi:hypothetical protein
MQRQIGKVVIVDAADGLCTEVRSDVVREERKT